jgi:hypothetical protein
MTNILDPHYESDLTEEEHNQLVLMSEHAVAPPLSLAAQAVLCAFRTSHTGPGCLAAALRAAALYCKRDRLILLSLADELEAQ